ncbi:MAG: hypothetical protein GYA47_07345 [Desulfovibrio sp.]|nr:hypothetical protein [Desulfovibrio sp.]
MPGKLWQLSFFMCFLLAVGSGSAMAAEAGNAAGPEPKPAVAGQAPGKASGAAPAGPETLPDAAGAHERKPGKPGHPVPGSPAVQAAEGRYQNYLDREKAASDADLARQRGKLEDKYKGFVRTVKPRGKKSDGDEKPAK